MLTPSASAFLHEIFLSPRHFTEPHASSSPCKRNTFVSLGSLLCEHPLWEICILSPLATLSVEISNLRLSLSTPHAGAWCSSSFQATDLVLSVLRDRLCIQVHPMPKAGPAQGQDGRCLWIGNAGSSRSTVHTD